MGGMPVQGKAASVDAYIEEAPADRQETLRRLRSLCLECLPGFAESMDYGMPSYRRNGVDEAGFASQGRYLSLYILKQDVLDAHWAELGGISVGKGCIRYTKMEKIDFGLVRRMLEETYASSGPVC
jgi:uncharacterized protein YdhG (YjbR/CyaY superfamily)